MHSRFHRFLDRFWEAFWAPLASYLASKIAPKNDPVRPWSTDSSLERAREPQDPQKSLKMEPKVSPRPSKSTLGRVQATKTVPQNHAQNKFWPTLI